MSADLKNLKDETVYSIIDEFENLLEKHDIQIPSEDDDGTDEFRSNIYGTEYYELENRIKDILENYDKEKDKLCSIVKNNKKL